MNVQEMNERELLAEILEQQRKGARNSRILIGILGAIAGIALVVTLLLVPGTIRTISKADALITQGQESMDEISEVVANIEELSGNANELVENNTETATELMEKINRVDFESLNRSIKNLSDILDPMAKFFNRF